MMMKMAILSIQLIGICARLSGTFLGIQGQRQTTGYGTYDRNVSAEIVGGQYDGNIHQVRKGAVSSAHQMNHGSYFRNKAYQGKHQDRVTGN